MTNIVAGSLALLVAGLQLANADVLQRDPFIPPAAFQPQSSIDGAVEKGIGELKLRGILATGDKSLVNIDGKLIELGEEIDGYKLLEIGESHAVLEHGDRTIRVELYTDE